MYQIIPYQYMNENSDYDEVILIRFVVGWFINFSNNKIMIIEEGHAVAETAKMY